MAAYITLGQGSGNFFTLNGDDVPKNSVRADYSTPGTVMLLYSGAGSASGPCLARVGYADIINGSSGLPFSDTASLKSWIEANCYTGVNIIDLFKSQIAAISGIVTNDDGLAIYADLEGGLRSNASLFFFSCAYSGNNVYAMDSSGTPVALVHSRGTNATYVNKEGQLTLASGPRFDYNPSTLVYNGLLLERAATNLVLTSDPTTTEGASTSVTYASYVWTIGMIINSVVFGDNSTQRTRYSGSVIGGTIYVYSCYVIMDDGLAPVMGTSTGTGDFNLLIGNRILYTDQFTTGVIDCRNGVYRCWATGSAASTGTQSGPVKFTNNSTRGFKCSGFQLETGAYPTSYIPTSGATATRAADTFASSNDVIPYTEAAIYLNQAARKETTLSVLYVVRGDTNGRVWYEADADMTRVGFGSFDGASVITAPYIANDADVFEKGVTTYGSAGLKIARNGMVPSVVTFDGVFGSAGALTFMFTRVFTYRLRAFVIVPRQLSDVEIQNATL